MSRFDRRCDTEVHEVRRLEVINGDVGRRKWPAERKGEIVAESMQPGVVVSEVARRHNLTPQQLFAWRHDAKQGRLALPEEAMSFVPVVAAADETVSSRPASGDATDRDPSWCCHDQSARRCAGEASDQGSSRCEGCTVILPGGPARVFVATKPVDFRKGFGRSLRRCSGAAEA